MRGISVLVGCTSNRSGAHRKPGESSAAEAPELRLAGAMAYTVRSMVGRRVFGEVSALSLAFQRDGKDRKGQDALGCTWPNVSKDKYSFKGLPSMLFLNWD
jgi:hypothetical protein